MILNPTRDTQMSLQSHPLQIGDHSIRPMKDTDYQRVLGLRINSTLNWSCQISHLLHKQIRPPLSRLHHPSFPYHHAITVYQEKIASQLNFTCRFLQVPPRELRRLDVEFRQCLKKLDPIPYYSHQSLGLYNTLKILPLETLQHIVCVCETLIRLTSPGLDGISARERADSISNHKLFLFALRNRTNRIITAVKSARRFGLKFYNNSDLFSRLETSPRVHPMVEIFPTPTLPDLPDTLHVHVSHSKFCICCLCES